MLSYFLRTAVNIYSFLILIYILASWIPNCQPTSWYKFIFNCVDPYLSLFRKFIPRIGFIDISPMIALFCLEAVPFVVLRTLRFIFLNILQSPWLLRYI
ncbi:YggT family protein [Chlamydia sp. 17-3921]|uniref:YggT family protein n=1 Tax=Chlamydia sp. 17-3921 TaxID=2675798 RepID=UPI00191B5458|nr:YggT family protein [Chlamydia sp. 17-3921]